VRSSEGLRSELRDGNHLRRARLDGSVEQLAPKPLAADNLLSLPLRPPAWPGVHKSRRVKLGLSIVETTRPRPHTVSSSEMTRPDLRGASNRPEQLRELRVVANEANEGRLVDGSQKNASKSILLKESPGLSPPLAEVAVMVFCPHRSSTPTSLNRLTVPGGRKAQKGVPAISDWHRTRGCLL